MIKLNVDQLETGMVAAQPIVTKRGQTIAPAGTVLTAQLIAKLSFYRIQTVMIDESSLPKAADKQPVAVETTSADSGAKAPTTAAAPLHETSSRESASQRQRIQVSP